MAPCSIIILEGCDKTGKTSMATALSEVLTWPVVKHGPPKGGYPLDEYYQTLTDHPEPFIADRYHVGESVYGPLYRGGRRLNQLDLRAFEAVLSTRNALLVLMEDDAQAIVERFRKLNEAFARADDIPSILSRYRLEFGRSKLQKVALRYSPLLPYTVAALAGSIR